jgi:predicted amidophosphoribosyltransferase
MKTKNNIIARILSIFHRQKIDRAEIDRLTPEQNISHFPGPFEFSLGIASFSIEDFHRRSDMGQLIRLMKNSHSTEAADRLRSFLILFLEENPLPRPPEVIVTIPDSQPDRPFRPMAYLADGVGNHFGWSSRHDIIHPIRSGKPQKERSFEARLADKQPRYDLQHPEAVEGRIILLFDDVYATGSSLIEAAGLISEHAAASIMALTLAKLE